MTDPKSTEPTISQAQLQDALDRCASEPIHIPGTIQPHGYLLILSQDLRILKISANLPALIEQSDSEIIGWHLGELISEEEAARLADLPTNGSLSPSRYACVSLKRSDNLPVFDAVMHRSGEHFVLELEPRDDAGSKADDADYNQQMIQFSMALQRIQNLDLLYQYIVDEIQKLTGFARVKLYKFDESWNGSVVAEQKHAHMASYLGLSFPASDIPKQARLLYTKSYLRIIPNAAFSPVKITPDDLGEDGKPIDLSLSLLRSVSPVHLQYLQNMGVGASMSISVMQDGQLWGLIACHHDTPRRLNYPLRMTAELMTHTFSAMLASIQQANLKAERQTKQSYLEELQTALAPNASLFQTIENRYALALKAINADGALISIGDKKITFGRVPDDAFSQQLVAWLEGNHKAPLFNSQALNDDTDGALTANPLASGVVAYPVSAKMTDYVLWFRREQAAEVRWAGRPEKNVSPQETGFRLTPRGSFDQWKETVYRRAKPWSEQDIEHARDFTNLLVNKKYEDYLHQSDFDLQTVLNNSNAPILITGTEREIIEINDSALSELMLNKHEVIGRDFGDVFAGNLAECIANHRAEVLQKRQSTTQSWHFEFNNDSFHYATVTFPLFDEHDGEIYALCSICTDISELQQAQEELKRTNKELERTAFIASHDLQEPIRMIASFSKLLNKQYGDKLDSRAQEYIEFTITYAERMKVLIEDLLQYSRLVSEEVDAPSISTDEELKSVLKQFELSGAFDTAELVIETDMPRVNIKPEHFACIMQNLISNALKYQSEERPTVVKVAAKDIGRYWQFSVADNGIGIAPEFFEKVFAIFQRLHGRNEYQGTGIGLALCARIIERYKGRIWVESQPGVGSQFFFTLPKGRS